MVLLALLAVALIFFYFVGMPIWLLALSSRVSQLETSLKKKEIPSAQAAEPMEVNPPQEVPQPEPVREEQTALPSQEPAPETPVMAAAIPSAETKEAVAPAPEPVLQTQEAPEQPAMVQMPETPAEDTKSAPQKPAKKPLSFVELFSWVGGVILLLGVVLAIKYALEKDLISATMRVLAGSALGIAVWVTGLCMQQERTKITADTLCACGLCTCYSVWFASYYFYQKPGLVVTFILLSLVALASFVTAVKRNAPYIGILAQIIGFLTPVLFRTDEPHIWFFLVYTAIINVAAICAAIKRNWTTQLYTSLAFTFLCFFGVINKSSPLQLVFFPGVFSVLYTSVSVRQKKTPLLVCSFILMFIGLLVLGSQHGVQTPDNAPYLIGFSCFFAVFFGLLSFFRKSQGLFAGIVGFCALSFLMLLGFPTSFATLLSFFTVISLFFTILSAWRKDNLCLALSLGLTTVSFVLLQVSIGKSSLDPSLLPWIFGFACFFSLLFSGLSYKQQNSGLLLGTIGVATLFTFGLLPFRQVTYLFVFVGVFTACFGLLAARLKQLPVQLASIGFTTFGLVGLSFLAQLHPAMCFVTAALIFYGWLALSQQKSSLWVTAVWGLFIPLLCLFLRFWSTEQEIVTSWYIGWSMLAILVPYIYKKPFQDSKSVWISTALYNLFSGLVLLVAWAFEEEATNVALLLTTFHVLLFAAAAYWQTLEEGIQKIRLTALSWAPCIFLTLWIILQFHQEYQILALAAQGTALVCLWRKLKLPVLQGFGVGVLALVFVSLLFNPAIAHYHEQNPLFFNWYLYVYLACAAAMFVAAREWQLIQFPAVANVLRIGGGILLFALVHIEIANYFSGGEGLHFHLCGEVTEAAAYTIAWAFCGAICMFLSNRKAPWLLQVGIGLIGLAVFKLFMADYWQLSGMPKIIVLVGVAMIMLGVSFVYQKLSLRTKIK